MSSVLRKPWTRDELILAVNLYCKTPFGKIHTRNPQIIALAKRLDRTPGSVSYKLANFASIDPSLPRKGASNVSKLDKEVWNDFFNNWEEMAYQSEVAFSGKELTDIEAFESGELPEGKEKKIIAKARLNHTFFRKAILASYEACCITGLSTSDLLVASHIIPWSVDVKNRTNPRNGLCLNYLHDKAFDVGLLTISEEFTVKLSPQIRKSNGKGIELLTSYDGKEIQLPKRFIPDQKMLAYHRSNIFKYI